MKTVIYKQQRIQLEEKNSLGTGGEATVILHDKLAFKIYHTPSNERSEKLKDFLKLSVNLPDNVAFPIDLVFDSHVKNKIIGFTMPVANKCKEVINLSNKKFRLQEQITANEVVKAFIHIKSTLDRIHSSNLIIGDFNDLNILFNPQFLSVFIDVDSYQFSKYPCMVGTDQFIDSKLYGIDLSKKPYFSKETDWYSFAVMLFKCLLFSHPYGGTHKTYQTLFARAQHKITVFEKDVIYPKIAINPDTLSDELLDYFHKIFKEGQRINLPEPILTNLDDKFIQCKKCSNFFYSGRRQCPVCYKVVPKPVVDISQIIVTQIDDDKCLTETLFFTEGTILFSKVLVDQRIVLIEYVAKKTNLQIYNGKTWTTIKLWDNHIKGVKFDFFQNYLVVCLDDGENELLIFEVLPKLKALTKTVTKSFDSTPVFACSQTNLYRLTEQVLSICSILNNTLVEKVSIQTLENQTWLDIGSNDLGVGYFRIFDKYHYFVVSPQGRFEINFPKIQGKIIETVAEFSKNTILLLQKTLDKGRTYSHYYIIDNQGKILESKTEESIGSELLKNLSGKVLVGTTIIHSSDAGIVLEKNQQLSLKKETASYVDSNDKLFLYKDGILAVSDHQTLFMRLIK